MTASALVDGCRFNPTLGGTTDWTFSSAVTGYNTPALANVVAATQYSIRSESADLSQWEFSQGLCTIAAGVATFARTTVLYNSAGTGTLQSGAGTKISFSAVPQVAVVALKEDLKVAPTRIILTTASTSPVAIPAGALYIRGRMKGAGGGGAGTGTGSPGAGANGTATTFNSGAITAPAGSGCATGQSAGAGGAAGVGGDFSIPGVAGEPGITAVANAVAGKGGGAKGGPAGGVGGSPAAQTGATNSGCGGGGGGASSAGAFGSSGGGGEGADTEFTITAPASSYAFVVGVHGAAGVAGTSGFVGAAGADGLIILDVYFN